MTLGVLMILRAFIDRLPDSAEVFAGARSYAAGDAGCPLALSRAGVPGGFQSDLEYAAFLH